MKFCVRGKLNNKLEWVNVSARNKKEAFLNAKTFLKGFVPESCFEVKRLSD